VWTLAERLHPRHRLAARARPIYDRLVSWDAVEEILAQMIAQQEEKVLAVARRLVPHVTPEDVRNAHDFASLVESADFNFEDGIRAGLTAALVAVRAARRRPPNG